MIIYNYDPITLEYMCEGESCVNPINPDEPIIPACATTIKPLKSKKGYTIVWVGNNWDYREDHRNELWYNAKTKELETITFIGVLPDYYYTPDSPIANPPEGDYWQYDSKTQTWVGNAVLYKQYVLNNFNMYWNQKQNTPFEFKGHKYLPSWRDLYTSIYSTLNYGIKNEYRLQDYDGNFVIVNGKTMKPIYTKMAEIVDQMYIDKQDLEEYFKSENKFEDLQEMFNKWLQKTY